MLQALNALGQIAIEVTDVDRAEAFYGGALGLRKLFRFGDLAFFDMAGVRLLIEKGRSTPLKAGILYFRVADIAHARKALEAKGVTFTGTPHLQAPMEDHDLWMTFFNDPDGHVMALMMEAPKGYTLPA